MSEGRVKKSERNLRYGAVYQVVYLGVMFLTRVTILKFLGLESLSVNNLFAQVISLLSLTEAGLSQCVTFRLYKPMAENDHEKLAEITTFYDRTYKWLAVIMFVIGLCLIPCLPLLVKNIEVDWSYLDLVYLIFLANTCVSYIFTSRLSIIWADQKTYLQAKYNIIFRSVFFILDLICICVFRNYIAFLITEFLYTVSFFGFMNVKIGSMYPYIKEKRELPDKEKRALFRDVRRMFIGKVSGKVLNSTDNVLISSLVGTNYVGIFGQYSMFQNGFLSLFAQVNEAVVGSVGNSLAVESKEHSKRIYDILTYFFFAAGAFCSCCVFVGVNPFLRSIIGKQYLLENDIVAIISTVLFIEILKMPLFTFFSSAGMFKEEQYISLWSCIINLATSIILGLRWGMMGIFTGTIISLIISIWFKAKELGHKKFQIDTLRAETKIFGYIGMFLLELLLCHFAATYISVTNGILEFLLKCMAAGTISILLSTLPFLRTEEFLYWKDYLKKKIRRA